MKKQKNIFLTEGSNETLKQLSLKYASWGYNIYLCGNNSTLFNDIRDHVEKYGNECFYSICNNYNNQKIESVIKKAEKKIGYINRFYINSEFDISKMNNYKHMKTYKDAFKIYNLFY